MIRTHTRTGVAISAMKCGLLPISQHAMRVQREVSYHDYEGIALDMDERTRLARDLGRKSRAMILRNQGLLTLGATVREAFELMYYLDCACWTARAATMPVGKVLFAVIAQSSFFPPVRVTHGDD